MIDAVLCELEGVVVETAVPRRRAMMHTFAEAGLDMSGIHVTSRVPVRDAVVAALAEGSASQDATLVDLLAAKANRHFLAEVATGLTLAPGALEALSAFQSRTRLALVTRADRDATDRILSMAGLDGLFEVIITGTDVIESKPHPEGHRAALSRLTNRRPVTTPLAIEDGLSGVRAARRAGIPCVVVGPSPAHEALEANAMIDTLAGHTLDSLGALIATGGARVA
jgi:HAD superfamily hydrolase (TIGR01509 family)